MNGQRFLIYVTESCGRFKFAPVDRYDAAVVTGFLDITPEDTDRDQPGFQPDTVEPHYMALVEVVANHDFLLGGPRPDGKP